MSLPASRSFLAIRSSCVMSGVMACALSCLAGCGGSTKPAVDSEGAPESNATSREACAHGWSLIKREAGKEFAGKSDEEAIAQCLEKLQSEGADSQRLHCEIGCVMAAEHLKQIDACVRRYCIPSTGH